MRTFNKIVVVLLFGINYLTLQSKQIELNFCLGINSVEMSSLKSYNKSMIKTLPFDAVIIDNFPAYLFYQFEFIKPYSSLELGFVFGYSSTGSRISYQDYSGTYALDNLVSAYNIGGLVEFDKDIDESFSASINIEAGFLVSLLDINEKINIGSESTNSKLVLSSNTYYFSVGVKLYYKINEFLRLGSKIEYLIDIDNYYHLGDNEYVVLANQETGDFVQSNWDGLRIGLLFSIYPKHLF